MAAAAKQSMLRLKVWCVIGDVLNPAKAASRVVTHLERHGKTVYCVNPSMKTVETETLKRSLSGLPVVPDVIDLIINPAVGAEQMQIAATLGISNVFVQPGAGSDDVLTICKEAGMAAWPVACLHSICALIVKQGIEVTTAGKGELNAAISGLGSLAGVIGPGLLWGPLFKPSTGGNEHGSSVARWLGKGGHYVGCCCFMLAASLILRLTPNRFLFVDERSAASQHKARKPRE